MTINTANMCHLDSRFLASNTFAHHTSPTQSPTRGRRVDNTGVAVMRAFFGRLCLVLLLVEAWTSTTTKTTTTFLSLNCTVPGSCPSLACDHKEGFFISFGLAVSQLHYMTDDPLRRWSLNFDDNDDDDYNNNSDNCIAMTLRCSVLVVSATTTTAMATKTTITTPQQRPH